MKRLFVPLALLAFTLLSGCTDNGSIEDAQKDSAKYLPSANNCPYEGAECPNAKKYMREYQVEINNDSITIYDGDRVVGVAPWDSCGPNCAINNIFLNDNQ
jgi:hypothetical protein